MTMHAVTLAGGQTNISDEALEELQARLRGPALSDGDPGVAEVRAPFNAMHPGAPKLTVECSGTADVVDAVNFARENELAVAVRGGGHSIAGLSSINGGMLIDLSPMNGVVIDADRKVAHVQGGALWADVDRESQAFGLATPGGVVSDTGVAGLTLGGGYGWLRRKYGLSCDHVIEAQVVCADGEVRTASAESNPDLYWALRGGGGNFGVVTSFKFRLHPLGPIVAFSGNFYPLEDARDIVRGWRAYVEDAPNEVTSVCVAITFPADPEMPEAVHDRPCIIVGGVYSGDPDEGMKVLQPLRELGTHLVDLSQPMPFTAVQTAFDPLFPRGQLRAYWKSQYLNELSDGAIDLMAEKAAERPAPITLVNMFHMGGAIADVAPEDTAFSERSSPYMVSIDGMWSDPGDDADNVAWVCSTWDAFSEYGTGGVYLNFTGRDDEAPSAGVDSALGRNMSRLAEVKAKYDPENFFRLNNNIAPAAS
jgi:FAD binding domain/Berberine and berberine like